MASRILVVEDERLVAINLELTLESLGFEVVGNVASGEEAVHQANEMKPELVLMDILLAGKMDGIEAAEQIRSIHDIPIVYLSAYSDSPSFERVKKTEPYGYLTKPFVPFELHGTIETALYKHKMENRVKQSEAALKKSNDTLEALFNATTEVMALMDADGNVLALNRRALQIVKKDKDQVVGKSGFEFLPAAPSNEKKAIFERVVESGAPCKFEDMVHDRILEGQLYPVFGADDEVVAVALFAMDITERKQAEEALKAGEQMLRGILATSPVGIGFTKDRKILWVNDAWASMFGFQTESDYIGKDTRILYPSSEEYKRVGRILYSGLAEGTMTEADATFKRSDRTVFDANIRMSWFDPLDMHGGTISAITDKSGGKQEKK